MAFGYETAGGIHDAAAAVGDVAVSDHGVRFSGLAEAERVEGYELVGGEAVVKFDEGDFGGGGCDGGFGEGGKGGAAGGAVAD